ncbi:MAG: hypothetical protein HQK53_08315 [Oligoflexia bacterium]|nr:hypothetical protein [Oligoflexia bacterium]
MVAKRVAGVALQDVTADGIIKANAAEFKDIKKIEPPLASKAYFLMFSHQFQAKHPDLVVKAWEAIEQIRENEYKSIVANYALIGQ